MPDTPVPPGTYAGQSRSPIVWAYLCPPCGGYAPIVAGDYDAGALSGACQGCGSWDRELHRFPSLIDSAAGCGCRMAHQRVTGDLLARPALDDSERFQVEECRRVLAGLAAGSLAVPETYGSERALRDVGRTLLDLLDKIAPKGADDDR